MQVTAFDRDRPVLNLSYERRGSGEPLLLVHGFGMSRRAWEHLIGRLARERDVIAVDWPGFGASPPLPAEPEPTVAEIARMHSRFLEEIGVESAHVVGVSAGGWVALELGKTRHARSVTAICPGGFWRGRMPRYVSLSLRVIRVFTRALRPQIPGIVSTGVGRAMLLSQVTAKPWRMTPDQAVELCRSFSDCSGFERVLRASIPGRFTRGAEVRVPVTIAHGERDRLMLRRQSQHWDEAPTQARFVALPACGHVPLWDDPDRVVAVILDGSEPESGDGARGARSDEPQARA